MRSVWSILSVRCLEERYLTRFRFCSLRRLFRAVLLGGFFFWSRLIRRQCVTEQILLRCGRGCRLISLNLSGQFSLALDSLRCDDDRVGQPFRPSAGLAERLVCFRATRPRTRNLLELPFQLFFRQLASLEPVTGIHDFFNIEFKNIASPKFAGRPFAPTNEEAQPPAAFTKCQGDFL